MKNMKRTLYIGAAASGKSYAASLHVKKANDGHHSLLNGQNLRRLKGRDIDDYLMHMLNRFSKLEKIIIIDDVPRAIIRDVMLFFCNDTYELNPQYKPQYTSQPEEIILIADCDTLYDDLLFVPYMPLRYQIFKCLSASATGVIMELINTSPAHNPKPIHN